MCNLKYAGTTASAQAFARAGKLEEWVHLYLHAEGDNVPFSDGIRRAPRHYFGLHTLPAQAFERICGPEPGMRWPVEAEGFERIVRELMYAYQEGRDVPPLIAEYRAGEFTLNDGNHRHEALVRLNVPEAPVIVWITEAADAVQFLKEYP